MTDENQKPWGFCVTKDSTCTMNYCDENGCQDRIRVPVEPIEPMSNESETIEDVFYRCTSTDFSSRDREDIFRAMQEYSDLQNAEMKAQAELNAKTLKSQNIAILRHLADKGEMVAVLSDTLTTLKAFLPDAWATINHVESTVQKFTPAPKPESE